MIRAIEPTRDGSSRGEIGIWIVCQQFDNVGEVSEAAGVELQCNQVRHGHAAQMQSIQRDGPSDGFCCRVRSWDGSLIRPEMEAPAWLSRPERLLRVLWTFAQGFSAL
jgi:hypothetical protein